MAVIETVAYTSSNWISWSSAIYRWHAFRSAAESPLGCSRLVRWGAQQFQPCAYPVFLTVAIPLLPFPSHYSPLISNCSVDASWGYSDGLLCSFSLIWIGGLASPRIRNPGRSPAKPRDNANPSTRADGDSLPLTQGAITPCPCTNQNRNGRFELWGGPAGVRASILIASCTVQYILLSFLLQW